MPLPVLLSSRAAAHSGERLGSDENEARLINACTSVVNIACDLLNKLAIRLENLFVTAAQRPTQLQRSSTPMIELRGIGKTYQMGSTELVALADVNLHIARNEYVALIGPSGSGKSTLMNILGCLDMPTTGTYMLDGEAVAGLNEDQLAACATARSASSSRTST